MIRPQHLSQVTRLLVADDHPISRSGIEFLLAAVAEVELVGFASDGEETLALAHQLQPDVVVLDLVLPKIPGLVVLERLKHGRNPPRVVAVSGQASGLIFKQALDLGADAVISKEDDSEELLAAIRALGRGERYRSPTVERIVGALTPGSGPTLTAREREVLALVAQGLSNDEIGARLGMASKTSKKHRENIRAKLGVSTAVEAAQAAVRLGLAKIG
jgi:DNA-binding NarL/FixJ family response regulator